jgi:hypothetical protein
MVAWSCRRLRHESAMVDPLRILVTGPVTARADERQRRDRGSIERRGAYLSTVSRCGLRQRPHGGDAGVRAGLRPVLARGGRPRGRRPGAAARRRTPRRHYSAQLKGAHRHPQPPPGRRPSDPSRLRPRETRRSHMRGAARASARRRARPIGQVGPRKRTSPALRSLHRRSIWEERACRPYRRQMRNGGGLAGLASGSYRREAGRPPGVPRSPGGWHAVGKVVQR